MSCASTSNRNDTCTATGSNRTADNSTQSFAAARPESLQDHLRIFTSPTLRSRAQPPMPPSALFSSVPQVTDYADRREFLSALLDEAIKLCDDDDDDDGGDGMNEDFPFGPDEGRR